MPNISGPNLNSRFEDSHASPDKSSKEWPESLANKPSIQEHYNDAIVDLKSIPVEQLKHTCSSDLDEQQLVAVVKDLNVMHQEIKVWYKNKYNKEFDRYNLGDTTNDTLKQYWNDPRFKKALRFFDIPHEQHGKILRPWYFDVSVVEKNLVLSSNSICINMKKTLTYSTQVNSQGLSVAGLVQTKGDADSPNGYLVLGLRGGAHHYNSIMLFAGTAEATNELINGEQSLWDVFVDTELSPELGVTKDHIKQANCLAQINHGKAKTWPHYVFNVSLKLTREELQSVWDRNSHRDKGEHKKLVYIPNDTLSVHNYLDQHFVGDCKSNRERLDSEQHILPIAALALVHKKRININLLNILHQPGFH